MNGCWQHPEELPIQGVVDGLTEAATQLSCSLLPAWWLFLLVGSAKFPTSGPDSEAVGNCSYQQGS